MQSILTLAFVAPLSLSAATALPAQLEVAPFDAVQVQGNDLVEIVEGPTGVVVTDADPVTLSQLRVETVGGVLRIGRKPEACRWPGTCAGRATFRVSSPRLSRMTMQGSGGFRGHALTGPRVAIVMQGSGDARFDRVATTRTDVELDGSGVVDLKGRTADLSVSANGGGTLDAAGLDAGHAEIAMNGGGSVRARAIDAATVTANGGGTVRVDGTSHCRIVNRGGADVRCGTDA